MNGKPLLKEKDKPKKLRKPKVGWSKKCLNCSKLIKRAIRRSGRKETPRQYAARKFCTLKCFSDSQRGVWRVENPQWMAAHHRARRILKKIGLCEVCNKKQRKTDVHHIDHNWRNNKISNLQEICRSCHIKLHRKK